MSRIISLIRRSFNSINSIHYTTMLGRWNREPVFREICIKIDQANEDHCGCCVLNNQNQNDQTIDYELDQETLKYYCMY